MAANYEIIIIKSSATFLHFESVTFIDASTNKTTTVPQQVLTLRSIDTCKPAFDTDNLAVCFQIMNDLPQDYNKAGHVSPESLINEIENDNGNTIITQKQVIKMSNEQEASGQNDCLLQNLQFANASD